MAFKSWISSNYSCFKQTRRLLEASGTRGRSKRGFIWNLKQKPVPLHQILFHYCFRLVVFHIIVSKLFLFPLLPVGFSEILEDMLL